MNFFRRLFQGRNGIDQLSISLLILGMVFLLLSYLPHLYFLTLLYTVCVVISLLRSLSRNTYRRSLENTRYLALLHRAQAAVRLRARMLRELPTHRYLRCPTCRQRLRVPRGRGKIRVTCSRCHTRFVKKV